MSHIILKADFEDVAPLLEDRAFKGEGMLLLPFFESGFFVPVLVAPCAEGVILRVEGGDAHLFQEGLQIVLCKVASFLVRKLGVQVVRASIPRRMLRIHGLLDS